MNSNVWPSATAPCHAATNVRKHVVAAGKKLKTGRLRQTTAHVLWAVADHIPTALTSVEHLAMEKSHVLLVRNRVRFLAIILNVLNPARNHVRHVPRSAGQAVITMATVSYLVLFHATYYLAPNAA